MTQRQLIRTNRSKNRKFSQQLLIKKKILFQAQNLAKLHLLLELKQKKSKIRRKIQNQRLESQTRLLHLFFVNKMMKNRQTIHLHLIQNRLPLTYFSPQNSQKTLLPRIGQQIFSSKIDLIKMHQKVTLSLLRVPLDLGINKMYHKIVLGYLQIRLKIASRLQTQIQVLTLLSEVFKIETQIRGKKIDLEEILLQIKVHQILLLGVDQMINSQIPQEVLVIRTL